MFLLLSILIVPNVLTSSPSPAFQIGERREAQPKEKKSLPGTAVRIGTRRKTQS